MLSKLPSDDILAELYSVQRLTMEQIGDRYGVTAQRVQQVLAKANIPRNPRPESGKGIHRDVLAKLYLVEKLPIEEIAAKLQVPPSRVRNQVKRHGLRRRRIVDRFAEPLTRERVEEVYVRQGKTQVEAAAELGMSTVPFLALLRKFGITHRHSAGVPGYKITEADLRRLFIDENRTPAEIAQILGCSRDTVNERLLRFGIRKKRGYRRPNR
jgi:DNA-binding transcriptional regulator LsrR (DeoR family)